MLSPVAQALLVVPTSTMADELAQLEAESDVRGVQGFVSDMGRVLELQWWLQARYAEARGEAEQVRAPSHPVRVLGTGAELCRAAACTHLATLTCAELRRAAACPHLATSTGAARASAPSHNNTGLRAAPPVLPL
jgi:hypothetical protein